MKLLTFNEFLQQEEVHPKILGALNKVSPDKILPTVIHNARVLKPQGQDTGLSSLKAAKGSSRAVLHKSRPHEAIVDGQPAKMKSIVKMTYQDSYKAKVGQDQNKVESSPNIQKHAMLIKQADGSYKTNKHGAVPPVFEVGKNHAYIHSAHADGFPETDHEMRAITKIKGHPGMTRSEFRDAIDGYGAVKNISHPMVANIRNFKGLTGVGDTHTENLGVWTHPHTGEKHIVLRDAGFDNEVAKHYNSWNGDAHNNKSYEERQRKAKFVKGLTRRPIKFTAKSKAQGSLGLDNPGSAPKVAFDPVGDKKRIIAKKQAAAANAKITHTPNSVEMKRMIRDPKVGAATMMAGLKRKDDAKMKAQAAAAGVKFAGENPKVATSQRNPDTMGNSTLLRALHK